ncbi:uncharacterized protein [Rutidosis leptorrhynchoides]|uniref:uncharacterized protein n=1 Tax=Rutidosis leptorrhynchoides TaxID=125765 RepID=UPI003A990A83
MRRVQIGRSGSRKAAALTIKSLNQFPVREKVLFPSEQASKSSDEDGPEGPTKQSVLRMSVQDKINLFESKQRDQKMDVPKTKMLFNKTNGAKKTVLRRWSSGMGVIATQNPDTNPETFSISPINVAPGPESDTTVFESQVSAEAEENIEPLEPLGVNVDPIEPENEERFEKHPASIEWSQEREAELNQMFIEMMENKPVSNGTNFPKRMRAENLDEETVGNRGEKVSEANSQQKSQKKSNPLSNSGRDASKTSVLKKATSKTSLPAIRKSWSSMTSPRPTVTSPGTNRTGREAKSASSTVRSTTKSERTKTLKATPTDANRILKTITGKNQSTLTKITKSTKANIQSREVNAAVKPSFCNKVTKKSSVVPLETKPFIRKGCGIGPGVGHDIFKSKVFGQTDKASRISETLTQNEENEVVMTPEITESKAVGPTKCTELTNNSCSDSFKPEINSDTESPVQIVSPVNVVASAGTSSLQVRRSLSEMLLEDSSEEADIGEWGNVEHLPVLIYEKSSPKGLKKLLKLARKNKSDFHPTRWSSASVFLDGDDGEVVKATRSSLFSLSTFRGNKTSESKLP